jgi:hypothetical protein
MRPEKCFHWSKCTSYCIQLYGKKRQISSPSLTCANKEHRILDTPLQEYDEKLRWTLSLTVDLKSSSTCTKNAQACVRICCHNHLSFHLRESYHLSSYQSMIRKRPTSVNVKLNADRKCGKVAGPWGTTVTDKHDLIHSPEVFLKNVYKEYKFNTLHHARSACWTCIHNFLRMAPRCRNIWDS